MWLRKIIFSEIAKPFFPNASLQLRSLELLWKCWAFQSTADSKNSFLNDKLQRVLASAPALGFLYCIRKTRRWKRRQIGTRVVRGSPRSKKQLHANNKKTVGKIMRSEILLLETEVLWALTIKTKNIPQRMVQIRFVLINCGNICDIHRSGGTAKATNQSRHIDARTA